MVVEAELAEQRNLPTQLALVEGLVVVVVGLWFLYQPKSWDRPKRLLLVKAELVPMVGLLLDLMSAEALVDTAISVNTGALSVHHLLEQLPEWAFPVIFSTF